MPDGDIMGVRAALIVATDTYVDPGLTRLAAPGADADALAEVLGDRDIGGFAVQLGVNQPAHEITRSIARFFADRHPDDLLLLHMSCHGVKDDSGELYFAATDTTLDLLEATGVSSSFVNRVMERSRAGRVLVFLDCCYSGAFARGLTSRSGGAVDVNERLGGKGRAVVTASSALQFAFEGQRLTDGDIEGTEPSVFTAALVRGLRTGEADRDRDGWVALDELYAYVHDEVTRVTPDQTPKKWTFDVQGDLYVARRGQPVTDPSDLPPEIADGVGSLVPWTRLGVVEPLGMLLNGTHPGLALAARQALERLAAEDDSDRVKQAAREALGLGHPLASSATAPAPSARPSESTPPLVSGRRTPVLALAGAALAVVLVLVGVWVIVRDQGPGAGTGDVAPATSSDPAEPDADSGAEDAVVAGLPAKEALVTRSDGKGGFDLLAVDTFSGHERVIENGQLSNPNISVDRTWIVFRQGTPGAPQRPVVARPDGSSPRFVMPSSIDCVGTGRPAWSHDGGRLAVVCLNASSRPTSLRTVTVGGEASDTIVTSSMLRESPTWTGHDTLIYGQYEEDRGPVTLMEVPADGSGDPEVLLESEGYWVSQLDWSDEGLLFIRSNAYGASGDIWLLDNDGPTQYSQSGDVTAVSWSPDGRSVVFTTGASPSARDQTLWVQRGDGSPKKLARGAFGPPSWASR